MHNEMIMHKSIIVLGCFYGECVNATPVKHTANIAHSQHFVVMEKLSLISKEGFLFQGCSVSWPLSMHLKMCEYWLLWKP